MKLWFYAILLSSGFLLIAPPLEPEQKNDFLTTELKEVETYIRYRDSINTEISKVPVAWHLDHILITINEIYKVMDTSNVENYKRRFNFGRTIMFTMNQIPRGRAQSPQIVKPPDIIITDSINSNLEKAQLNLKLFDSLPKKAHFMHPYIGMLNRKQAKKFLRIHTEHHLKIVRDILKYQP